VALKLADRVVELSTSTGTGAFTLSGAQAGYQAFSSRLANGDTTYYTIQGKNGDGSLNNEWEVGLGTYSSGTLTRDTVLDSSNSGSLVNFSAGNKDVFIDLPSEKAVVLDDTDKVSGYAITGGSINNTPIGATTASTGRFTSVTTPSVTATTNDLTLSAISTGAVKFNTANGTQVQINDSANTGQYTVFSRNNGSNVQLIGVNTSANLGLYSQGGGNIRFYTNINLLEEQFRIAVTSNTVNYVQVTGSSTGNQAVISVQGSDTNIPLAIAAKGTGTINLQQTTAIGRSATNWVAVNGSSASGNAVQAQLFGADTNIALALQTKGTGAINLAAGSSGVNISNGGTVTAVTRTGAGTGYTTPPTVAISAPTTAGGVQATATVTIGLVSVTSIANGGTGYTVGNTLTVSGGTFTTACQVTVTTVSGGVITGVSVTTGGSYTVAPTNPVSVTGGSGSGATFNLSFCISSTFTITNAGSGYIEQPTVTFSGGGGSGASAYATVGGNPIVRTLGSQLGFNVPSGEVFKIYDFAGQAGIGVRGHTLTGSSPAIFPTPSNGVQTNINLQMATLGTGVLQFATGGSLGAGGAFNQLEQLRVAHTASAVNYVQISGQTTGNFPNIAPQGSDANIGFDIFSKGTSPIRARTGGGEQLRIADRASANRYIQIQGGVSGATAPSIGTAGGTEALDFYASGGFPIWFSTNGLRTQTQFAVSHTVSAVNYLQATGGATGNEVTLSSQGSDAVVNVAIATKSTGLFRVLTASNEQFRVSNTASAVNYVQVTGGATTGFPVISAQGSDSNIALRFYAKGALGLSFWTNGGSSRQFQVEHTAGTIVNYTSATGSATGAAPSFSVAGSDTNIDLALTPKGTGLVRFGTYTNTVSTIAGYIEIRDAGGTIRRLAVVS
jgi:hypothetical protein